MEDLCHDCRLALHQCICNQEKAHLSTNYRDIMDKSERSDSSKSHSSLCVTLKIYSTIWGFILFYDNDFEIIKENEDETYTSLGVFQGAKEILNLENLSKQIQKERE